MKEEVNVRVEVKVDNELYHFWVTKGTKDEAHEFTRKLSMMIKKEKIWNLPEENYCKFCGTEKEEECRCYSSENQSE